MNKSEMYKHLKAGRFGNTTAQYMSVEEWLAAGTTEEFWGVRSSKTAGHPACLLYCPRDKVAEYSRIHFPDGVNISVMVDAIATTTAWLEIYDSTSGLHVQGIEYPCDSWTWRSAMPTKQTSWSGIKAQMLLRRHLNPNSYDDVKELLQEWPGLVIELSALDRCMGMCPHRNHIVWEVRDY